MLTLVIGGVRSGKSEFAESFLPLSKIKHYIATMQFYDKETKKRISLHQQRRDNTWTTVEQPINLTYEEEYNNGYILLDCLTNLVTNELFTDKTDSEIVDYIVKEIALFKYQTKETVIVSNNVFEDEEEYSELTERFLSVLGKTHVEVAKIADNVIELTSGITTVLKGEI